MKSQTNETDNFFQVKNEVVHEYLPIIGATGFTLYSLYKSMANHELGYIAWPSYKLIKKYMGLGKSTISCYNWLLQECGLLQIEQYNDHNNYRLVKVNPVTPELITHLTKVLQPNPQEGIILSQKHRVRFRIVVWMSGLKTHGFPNRSACIPKTLQVFETCKVFFALMGVI